VALQPKTTAKAVVALLTATLFEGLVWAREPDGKGAGPDVAQVPATDSANRGRNGNGNGDVGQRNVAPGASKPKPAAGPARGDNNPDLFGSVLFDVRDDLVKKAWGDGN
jgi:hypothetical protein